MVVEMRTYKTIPGRRADFLDIFCKKSICAHTEIGMKILGPFLSIEDSDTFFFMRGFPDLASREPMKAKFYEGDLWRKELEHVLMPMLESYEVVLVDDPHNLIGLVMDGCRGNARGIPCGLGDTGKALIESDWGIGKCPSSP